MNFVKTEGIITTRHEGFVFYVCKITYILFEDESFRYEFEPYYDVIESHIILEKTIMRC